MTPHRHDYQPYELVNEEIGSPNRGKVYYRGFRCACGDVGYAIPGSKEYQPRPGEKVRVKTWPGTHGKRFTVTKVEDSMVHAYDVDFKRRTFPLSEVRPG